jgi:hypothetical protein
MTTTAMTWFYRAPEKIPYYIGERVNGTFWEARMPGVFLDVVRSEPPFLMEGNYNGAPIQMEWVPNKWLRLTTCPASPALAKGLANILRRKPNLSFETADGETIWEWRLEDADQRWQEIQGKPAFRNPTRLDAER